MKYAVGSHWLYTKHGGSALVRVIQCGLTLQSGLQLSQGVVVQVEEILQPFLDWTLWVGDRIEIQKPSERLQAIPVQPTEQLGFGWSGRIPD